MLESYGTGSDGWLTEYKVVSQEAVVSLPKKVLFEEGATLPCAAVTAWNALSGSAPMRAGQTVLTLGTGGVSMFAVQLAKAVGATVISTTSSAEKAERLKHWGPIILSITGIFRNGADTSKMTSLVEQAWTVSLKSVALRRSISLSKLFAGVERLCWSGF